MAFERPALVEVQRGVMMDPPRRFIPPSLRRSPPWISTNWTAATSPITVTSARRRRHAAQAAAFYGEGIERRQGREHEDRQGLMPTR